MTEPLETLIHYRLDRAQESLDDARLLAEAERWNACVNRLYYSCFYAVSALLVRDGLSSSRHMGCVVSSIVIMYAMGRCPESSLEYTTTSLNAVKKGIMPISCVSMPTKSVL